MASKRDELIGLGLAPELAGRLGSDVLQDSILPLTDNAVDLGSSTKEFKDAYFDGTVTADGLALDVATGISAAGTDLAGATQLAATINDVGTAGASSGVKLFNPPVGGMVIVRNGGANDLKVYPADASGTINGGSAGAAITLATSGKGMAIFWYVAANTWIAIEASSAA